MTIPVHGERDGAVPSQFLSNLRMYPARSQIRDERVPKGVKINDSLRTITVRNGRGFKVNPDHTSKALANWQLKNSLRGILALQEPAKHGHGFSPYRLFVVPSAL
jgi:hypothetical protein